MNRVAHVYVYCARIYTYAYIFIYIYIYAWSAICALRLLLLYRYEQSPGNIIPPVQLQLQSYSITHVQSLHAVGLLCSSCLLVWHRINRRPRVSRPACYQQRDFALIGLWPLGFRAFGPVGFWVYGRWDFWPLASETGNLKFKCEVRSSPKAKQCHVPLDHQRRAPKANGLRPSDCGLWLLEFCAWPPAL